MLLEIDYDKICQEALTDVGAYAPGEAITDLDKEAVSLRLSQMLTEDFLVKYLTERIRPLYGSRVVESESPSIRYTALDFAMRSTFNECPANETVERARTFLKFLENGE